MMHKHYLRRQDELLSDLMHNYGNMASTIAVCWNEVSEAHATFAKKSMSTDEDTYFSDCIEKAKSIAEMTQAVVISSARNLRGDFEYNPTRMNLVQALKYVPYFASNYQRFVVSIKKGTPDYVVIDYSVFLVCITNFASNAQKYSSGKILIEASYADGFVHIDVIDQGVGIPLDQQCLIFQRGQKSRLNKDLAAGQGIGLHSVASVLNKVGGRVGVSSPHRWEYDGKEGNAGPGSRFWFEMKNESPVKGSTTNDLMFHHSYKNLDVLQEAKKEFTGKDEEILFHHDHTFRVLLVEDNLFIQKATKLSLETYFSKLPIDCKVTCVPTEDPNSIGAQTLKTLTTGNTIYDMILLDQELGHKKNGNGCLWGTDVVIGYSKWIKEQESMREMGNDNRNALLKMKYQVIHLFSAGQIERSFLSDNCDMFWLKKCPFSKPILGHELENFKWQDYPRFLKKEAEDTGITHSDPPIDLEMKSGWVN